MCNVYRRFTVDIAKTAKPLNNLNSVKLPKRLSPPTPKNRTRSTNYANSYATRPSLRYRERRGSTSSMWTLATTS